MSRKLLGGIGVGPLNDRYEVVEDGKTYEISQGDSITKELEVGETFHLVVKNLSFEKWTIPISYITRLGIPIVIIGIFVSYFATKRKASAKLIF